MDHATVQPLDYFALALPRARRLPFARSLLCFCAVVGIIFNGGCIALEVSGLHSAAWVYHDLMQNSRAYGREIDPATIASLRTPWAMWIWNGVSLVGLAFGLLLAIHLLIGLWRLRTDNATALRRMHQYLRWKPVGTAITALGWYCGGVASWHFWTAATRHNALGSGPPVISTIVLVACALLPWWWLRRAVVEP